MDTQNIYVIKTDFLKEIFITENLGWYFYVQNNRSQFKHGQNKMFVRNEM